jgi:dipeptidyl aminopeptidase/acylaminoacyl peptidase
VWAAGPHDFAKIYLFDAAKNTLENVLPARPEFEGKRLSEQTIIHYKARDGMTIPAYLTLPEDRPAKNLPMVLYVHGGPHARDEKGYDPIVQMFASRGYAVLQPQFRMSTGFGWNLHHAGWRQWGMAMQDDLTDGVNALAQQGVIDKSRVCIAGASYGGYAVMYGLIKDPDLYKCGVNFVGVTDIGLFFSVTYSDTYGAYMDDMIVKMHGDPKDPAQADYFHKTSAIENADRIKAPVLMAYGSEDVRVPMIHGEKIRDKLRAKGNVVEWQVMAGEGHGWHSEENNIAWGQKMLDFVDRYIGKAK